MCGENFRRARKRCACGGSPPRVRGKLAATGLKYFQARITPACAGKTHRRKGESDRTQDHPRVCGENRVFSGRRARQQGSPPRVRGKPRQAASLLTEPRITPACAGKTLRKWRISVVDPSPQPRSSLTSRRADASIGSQRAPCAAPV